MKYKEEGFMKRKLSLATVLIIALIIMAGCASTSNENVVDEMSVVVEVPGKTADELFVLANSWAVDIFNSAEAVIEFSDKDAGIIKGTFTHDINGFNDYRTETTITIETREGRARITFDDPIARMTYFMGEPTNPSAWPWGECSNSQLSELNSIWVAMVADFENALNAVEDNW